MKSLIVLTLVALAGYFPYPGVTQDCQESQTTVKGSSAPQGPICSGDLIFEDNFDEFDTEKWIRENTLSGGGNGEFQWYTTLEENSFIRDGVLHIEPTFLADEYDEGFLRSGTIDLGDGCTESFSDGCKRTGTEEVIINPIKSGKLTSKTSFNFKYGVLETRAIVPTGDWLWPAIWLLPIDSVYGGWPASGEIDLLESRGNTDMTNGDGVNLGTQLAFSTLHWGPSPDFNRFSLTHWERNDPNGFNNDFHTYQVRWTPDSLTFSIDGTEIGTVAPPEGGFWELGQLSESGLPNPWSTKMAPFDQEFYLIINLAIGGTNGYFPDEVNYGGGKPWRNGEARGVTDFWQAKDQWLPSWDKENPDSHSDFRVDYVRVYAL